MASAIITSISLYKKLIGAGYKYRWTIKIELNENSNLTRRIRRDGTVFHVDLIRTDGSTRVFNDFPATTYADNTTGCIGLIARVFEAGRPISDEVSVATKGAEEE